MENNWIRILNELSKEINSLYGYVEVEGDNFGEPAINSGPCGAFANAFYIAWNRRFTKKCSIVFVMVNGSDECWHVLVRLPNGRLFDGGFGVHDEKKYEKAKLRIEDMETYDLKILDERSYGLERTYPRYCPSFSIAAVSSLIERYLNEIDHGESVD
jgi:hypothetical protein